MAPSRDPKGVFPDMPQEVFDLWIQPCLEDYGWPFQSADAPLAGTQWEAFFAGRTLRQWAQFAWQLVRVEPHPLRGVFHPDTVWRVQGIILHCVYALKTDMADIQDTRDRFAACAAFIAATGRLPAPLVGVHDEHPHGLELVDGHHRLAALLHVGVPQGFRIPVWLAHGH